MVEPQGCSREDKKALECNLIASDNLAGADQVVNVEQEERRRFPTREF